MHVGARVPIGHGVDVEGVELLHVDGEPVRGVAEGLRQGLGSQLATPHPHHVDPHLGKLHARKLLGGEPHPLRQRLHHRGDADPRGHHHVKVRLVLPRGLGIGADQDPFAGLLRPRIRTTWSLSPAGAIPTTPGTSWAARARREAKALSVRVIRPGILPPQDLLRRRVG